MSTFLDRCMIVAAILMMGHCSMHRAEAADTIVFVIQYLQDGKQIALTVGYGYSEVECEIHRKTVDKQPDPEGIKTVTSCIEESELPDKLVRGERT